MKKDYIEAAVVLGKPPDDTKRAWLSRRCMAAKPILREHPRLVNKFKLGADPEFIFEDSYRQKRVDANLFQLRPGVFVGADQNGRLAEIRPQPSASALEVVGSIMASLRLIGPLFPATLPYTWLAGAWLYDDGVGGHIHFGRKRPSRPAEVMAMDGLAYVLYHLQMFPMDQQNRRMLGDRFHQVYGHPSDYRLQIHGYEYRSLPSWLDSPWLAYLCITLAKLAVLNPDLVAPWSQLKNPKVDNIRYLLAYYRGVDDDAALCLYALEQHGLPVWQGGDFKARWGAVNPQKPEHQGINVYPGSVPASKAEISDLFQFFRDKTPIPNRAGVVDWTPTHLPAGYELMAHVVEFRGQVGMGEMFGSLVRHPKIAPVTAFAMNKGKAGLYVSDRLVQFFPPEWRTIVKDIAPGLSVQLGVADRDWRIGIHKKWRQGKRFSQIRKVLTCGLFPLWKVKDIDPIQLVTWEKRLGVRKQQKFAGKQLYP